MRKVIIYVVAIAAAGGIAVAAYADDAARHQARTMAAKLTKGDRTPISGYEVPGGTFYTYDRNGVLRTYQHQGDTSDLG